MELLIVSAIQVLREGVPSTLAILKTKSQIKERLEDYRIVKCSPGEKILNVQRQHPVAIAITLAIHLLITFLVLLILFLVYINAANFNTPFSSRIVISFITLSVICASLLLATYNFLFWYYRFYIITNKCIIHRHSFRIGGEYTETVYGEKMHVQDIDRVSTNFFYYLLRIQDVYVYFHRLEREEPFIFESPNDAQKIDDIIQGLANKSRNGDL